MEKDEKRHILLQVRAYTYEIPPGFQKNKHIAILNGLHTFDAHTSYKSYTYHAYKSPTHIVHTNLRYTSCIQVPHTHHAYTFPTHTLCTQIPHTHHAYKSPTYIMHTSPPHASCIQVPHTHTSCMSWRGEGGDRQGGNSVMGAPLRGCLLSAFQALALSL